MKNHLSKLLKERIEWAKANCDNAPYVSIPTELAILILYYLSIVDPTAKLAETEEQRKERKRKEFEEDDGA